MIINLCGGSGGGSSAPIKLQGLIARENGTYTPDEGYDGYSEVLVDVTEPAEIFVVPDDITFGYSTFSEIPDYLDFSNLTSMKHMFQNCSTLQSIPELNTSKVTNMSYMFHSCSNLKTIPLIDTSNVTNMESMFSYCEALQSIPQLNTSKVTNMGYMFNICKSLQTLPLLECGNVKNMSSFLYGTFNQLTELGGFKDLKISVTHSFLNYCPNLTVESLMNVINNVYDLTANGLSGKSLKFGQTNLDKLTPEQIAVATAKGWTLIA